MCCDRLLLACPMIPVNTGRSGKRARASSKKEQTVPTSSSLSPLRPLRNLELRLLGCGGSCPGLRLNDLRIRESGRQRDASAEQVGFWFWDSVRWSSAVACSSISCQFECSGNSDKSWLLSDLRPASNISPRLSSHICGDGASGRTGLSKRNWAQLRS